MRNVSEQDCAARLTSRAVLRRVMLECRPALTSCSMRHSSCTLVRRARASASAFSQAARSSRSRLRVASASASACLHASSLHTKDTSSGKYKDSYSLACIAVCAYQLQPALCCSCICFCLLACLTPAHQGHFIWYTQHHPTAHCIPVCVYQLQPARVAPVFAYLHRLY